MGRVGFSTYQTNALFDNLTVTTTATGQTVPHIFTYKAGACSVSLTVAEAGGQTATGIIPMTMQRGAAPIAEAGGPYTVGEAQAVGGLWSMTLDGTGSSDDVEVRRYVWDFGADPFTGTTFQTGKWLTNDGLGISQSDAVSVTGNWSWSNRYLVTRALYPKVRGQIFETSLKVEGGGQCMFGFKNSSTTDFHYSSFPYSFYLYSGNIYIYEDGGNGDYTGFNYSNGVNYDFQIELVDSGAIYRYRLTGTTAWIDIYRSSHVTGSTELRKGITVYDSTFTLDNFRESTAGPNPVVSLFNNGGGSINATLTVYDRADQVGTDTATLNFAAGDPPVANAGTDQNLDEGAAAAGQWTASFDASLGSSDDVGIYRYEWDWNYDGDIFVPSGDTGPTPSHTWSEPGTYLVAVRVTDNAMQSHIDVMTVIFTVGTPPVANAGSDKELVETDASYGQWTPAFDATGSSDDGGISSYEWDWNYNGETFVASGDTGSTPSHIWSAPGIYTVALRVTDNALQSSIDTLTVTITQGNPPTADAGGPYAVDEITGNAQAGGFMVALDGSGSTDGESSVQTYLWDIGVEPFNGTTIDEGKWHHSCATQNGQITVSSSAWYWGGCYLFSKDTYSRAGGGMAFEAKVRGGNGNAMVGFKNTNSSDFSYHAMPYALYFGGGTFYIYEDDSHRSSLGGYSQNTWYDIRIELKPTSGALYYYRVSGDPDWILLYDSNNGSATEFKRGVDVYSGTFEIDDLKEVATGVSPSVRFFGLGEHTVTLTVTDQAGQPDSATATVTLSANNPPVPDAGADQAIDGDPNCGFFCAYEFSFDGSGSTDDHGIFTYEWDFDYDGTFNSSATGISVTHTYNRAGAHTVALRVTDHALQSAITTISATINAGEAPVANAGSDRTTEALWPVIFNGGGSTDDTGILKYEWSFGDGSTGVGKTPSHTYWAPGVYTATLTVFDTAFQPASDTVEITVLEAMDGPIANAGGPYTAAAGGPPAYLNGSASTDDYGIIKYMWDVDAAVDSDGDGNFTNDIDVIGRKPFHTYANAGTYTVTLTVVDGAGQTSTASTTVNVAENLAPDVICVPWRPGDPTIPHETYNGREVTFKAIVRDAGDLTYQWNFGDGSALWPADPAAVGNKYAIEATHTYPDSPAGTPYTATLTVWDSAGLTGQDRYYVIIRPDSLDTRTNIAIDQGLWYTHKNQNKGDGSWYENGGWGGYYASATASAIQAFEINGHLQTGDNQENPYVETVDRGLGSLFTNLYTVAINEPSYMTHGNPDTNGNGIALSVNSGRPIYEGGMVMDAIASSGTPLGFAITGNAEVKGRFFHDIVADMVDMYAYGQVDDGGAEGGWQYSWHGGADNSACQWAAIGMLAAEDSFGINVPQFVKDENNKWLTYSYDGTGFGYSGPGNGVALTPSGMVQLAFSDQFTNDPRWRTAEDYIANNWFWQNNNYYAMYAMVKALKLARPYPVETLSATGLDWYNDPSTGVRKHLVDQQYAGGYWYDYNWATPTLETSWAVIMLTPTLFVQAPVADAGDDIIWAFGMEIKFDASGSFHTDSSRHIVKYEWDFDGDGTYDFTTTDPADPNAVYTYADPNPAVEGDPAQVVTARLRVTDDNEPPQTDIDTREITVAEPPHIPFARPGGPYKATVGIPFTLDGSRSFDIDAGDSITTYQWDLDNDGVWFDNFESDTSQSIITYTYNTAGVYSIGLQVWDLGAFDPIGCTPRVDCIPSKSEPAFTTVTVEDNLPPVANAGGPYTVDEGTVFNLDGSLSSDPNGDLLTYQWDLDNDGLFDDATGVPVAYQFADNGDYTVGLLVSDSLLTGGTTTTVHVNNVAPTVSVGDDQHVNEGDAVYFNGSFSDPGVNDTHMISWDFGDGSAAVTGTLTPSHVYADNGTYTVTLTVTDKDGGVGSDTLIVTVHNMAPVVDAGANKGVNEGATVNFSGSFTEAGSADTHTMSWDFGDGSAPVTGTLTPQHVYVDNGTYTVILTVWDDEGDSGNDTLVVTVSNVAPVVNAGADQGVNEGATVNFSGSFTDVGTADTHTTAWTFGDGSGTTHGTLTPSHVYADNGTYTVTLTVTDKDGGVTADTLTVTVGNVAPEVNAGADQSVDEGGTVNFNGSFTDVGTVDTHTVSWNFGDGSAAVTGTLTPSHVYADNGTYTVTLTVTDDDGGSGSDTLTVTARNMAPTVNAGPDQLVDQGVAVIFAGSFKDPGTADTHTMAWTFGDGGTASGTLTPSHTFTANGIFTVTLTVTDDDGGFGSDSLVVEVKATTPPTGTILINNGAEATNTTAVTLNLSATDNGGSGLSAMHFRNGDNRIWSEWEPYNRTKAWTLSEGAGTKNVLVQVKDNAGNISDANPDKAGNQSYKDSIIYDPIAPTGTILINNGAETTTTTAVTLNLTATDTGGSGLGAMRLRNFDVNTWGEWEPYNSTKAWTLSEGAGNKNVLVQFKDAAGNISDAGPNAVGYQPYKDSIIYDPSAPTGTILINNGAETTTTTAVTLNLLATDTGGSGLSMMRLRNFDVNTWSEWEPYNRTKTWILSEGAGNKTVLVQFKDAAGNISDAGPNAGGYQAYKDSIIFDPIAPTGTILINNGAETTTTTAVTLNLLATDTGGSGLSMMRFRNFDVNTWSEWEPYNRTKAWTLSEGAGNKTVLAQFKDAAGNISDAGPNAGGYQAYKDSIIFDPIAPTGTILINNGDETTTTTAVTLNLSATDTGGSGLSMMRLRNFDVKTWGEWEPYNRTKTWTLSEGAGNKTVLVQFKDGAGNISDAGPNAGGYQPYKDSIIYDPIAPTGTILINNGAETTTTKVVTLNLLATDTGGSGLSMMRFRNNDLNTWSAWEPYHRIKKAWLLSEGAGVKTVLAQFKDAAGNISDANPNTVGEQPYRDNIVFTP